VTFFRLLHILALFWMMAGIGAVVVPVWRGWSTRDLAVRAVMLSEAQQNEARWLIPGVIAVVFSGFGWAAAENMNFFGTGWLLTKMVIYAIDVFIFLPLLGVGLRRVRYLALQAQKQGESTPELAEALQDRVPVVFGTLIVVTIPVMVALAVFRPF
jgi:uncharacterized membrane protein